MMILINIFPVPHEKLKGDYMAEFNKDKCSFQFPSSQSCRNISFAMLREGTGTDGNSDFVWKREWHDSLINYPNPYCDDPLDPPCENGDFPGIPGTKYYQTGPFELHTQFPFRKLDEIRITPEYLIFKFQNCRDKFSALKLYPEGSQIVITMNLNDPFGYNAPNRSVPIGNECTQRRNDSSAACFYFLSESFYAEQNSTGTPLEIVMPIDQFQIFQTDCGSFPDPADSSYGCTADCESYLEGLTGCAGISWGTNSPTSLDITYRENYYEMCELFYNYFRDLLLEYNTFDCACCDCDECNCDKPPKNISELCKCECDNFLPGTETGFLEYGLPPKYWDIYGGTNRCFFTIGTTIRICRKSEPFRST